MVFRKDGPTLKPNQLKVLPLYNQKLRKKDEFWKVSILESAIKPVSIHEI